MGFATTAKSHIPHAAHEQGRGRHADKPSDVPAKGWGDILTRTKNRISDDNLSVVAAGVAFYGFVAVVPTLVVVIALYGLLFNPAEVSRHIEYLARVLPQEVLPLLKDQMTRLTSHGTTAGVSAIVGVLFALYSSANATKALITGLNIAYGEKERRSFMRLTLVAFALTIGAVIGLVLAVSLVAILPALLKHLPLHESTQLVLNIVRWPLLVVGFMAGLAVMYRYAPSRNDAKWRWVSWGAAVATLLWVAASGLFSFYVSKFGSYDKTYGSLAAVVVFLMWLYLSAFVVLIGAEMNSEMERQTLEDTTEGAPKPLGKRGAKSADTVGPARGQANEERETA